MSNRMPRRQPPLLSRQCNRADEQAANGTRDRTVFATPDVPREVPGWACEPQIKKFGRYLVISPWVVI